MNIKTKISILTSFLVAFPAYAAMEYPTIAGITISETTTASEYIIYFFNLMVSMGTFIAVIMIIMAGIEWVTSSGNPSKVESAKGKIMNTLLGVGVLLGCYLILSTINPNLTSIKIDDISCSHGIVVMVKTADGKIDQQCIDSSQSNIAVTILSTVSWNFPKDYFLRVYTYSELNYQGNITEFNCESGSCSGDIAGAKSIWFVEKKPGIYLFDGNSYSPANPAQKGYPLYINSSAKDLSKTAPIYENATGSIKIVGTSSEDKEQFQYYAVAFVDQNYMGRCAFIPYSIPDMDTAASTTYTDTLGDGTISSVIVAKGSLDQSKINIKAGEVILYTKDNCGKSDTDPTKQIKSCHIPIYNTTDGQKNIFDADVCGGTADTDFKDGDEVMSFEITGDAGLVLSTSKFLEGNSKTSCAYFSKNDLKDGTCYPSIRNSKIFTVGGNTPKSFIVIPNF